MRVKKAADVHLAHTDLDWLIVRPGTLTDEPGTGLVSAGLALEYGTAAGTTWRRSSPPPCTTPS